MDEAPLKRRDRPEGPTADRVLDAARPLGPLRRRLTGLAKRLLEWSRESERSIPGIERLSWILYRVVKPRGLIRISLGEQVLVLDADDEIMVPELLTRGSHDADEETLLRRLVQPGDVVVDIGANVGVYTLLFSRLVGPEGRVIAVEPEPLNLALLEANVRINEASNVEIAAVGLAARPGTGVLHLDRWNFGGHTLTAENVSTQSRDRIEVLLTTLDELLGATGLSADLVKMDVQGLEGQVLEGAQETLLRDRPVLEMEFWPAGLRAAGTDPGELLERLYALGYRLTEADDPTFTGRTEPEQVVRGAEARPFVNLVFRPLPVSEAG